MQLRFLGYGNSEANQYGESAAVLEQSKTPILLIDCGHTALNSYIDHYKELPDAIYITHTHWDHIGGLESLFYKAFFGGKKIKLYAHCALIERLTSKLAHGDNVLAEGGANFWDAFQLIPVNTKFWHADHQFEIFESRHHQRKFCFGLRMPGRFVYTGDTKPIPEVLTSVADQNEIIFHDLSIYPQPSHTYIDELNQYPEALVNRMWFYHLNADSEATLKQHKLRSVHQKNVFELSRSNCSPDPISFIHSDLEKAG